MMISVIVCTYNRAGLLKTALESVRTMQIPPDLKWELIIVDNNSSDDTEVVIRNFQRIVSFDVRYFFERRQGQSRARNRGIVESRGDVLVFTDDDVIVHPCWLAELRKSYALSDCLGVGGRIVPLWRCAKPAWVREEGPYALMRVIVSFDQGDGTCLLKTPPFGANMSFRRTAFERYGLFRTDLGRIGTGLMGSEDTEFGRRLLRNNEAIVYTPRMIVYHPVETQRVSQHYFRRWYFNYGRALVRQANFPPTRCGRLQKAPLRRLGACMLRWALAVRPERRLYYWLTTWETLGQIREAFGPVRRTDEDVIPKLST